MKKVFGLVLVLLFIFSVLPANAGPAFEKLKKQEHYFIIDVRGEAPNYFLNMIANTMKGDGLTRVHFHGFAYEFYLTHVSHIFSDKSFRTTLRDDKKRHLFQKKLGKIFANALPSASPEEDAFEKFCKLVGADLASKKVKEAVLINHMARMEALIILIEKYQRKYKRGNH